MAEKEIYELGDKPQLGVVTKKMHAFLVRQDRFGAKGTIGLDKIVLTGFGVTALSHGTAPKVGDYIKIRRIFTIAKGRVGVT